MASLTPKNFYIGSPTSGSIQSLYTSNTNSGSYSIVKTINICNPNTTTAGNVTLYITASGGSAGVTNLFLSNLSVGANTSIFIDSSIIMSNNAIIATNISLAGMTFNVSGVEFIA
jgi:hypothetical protein